MTTALDTNILVGAMVSSTPSHLSIQRTLAQREDDLCVTPVNVGEALRLLTHPKVFPSPLKLGKAVTALSNFFDIKAIRVIDEEIDWWQQLPALEKQIPGLRGNEVFDARIALCLRANGVKNILTLDGDFAKYAFLRIVPLLT